jgi:PIF1 helicase.
MDKYIHFKSIDSITDPNKVVNYLTEFLNSLDLPGLPPHNLQLKVGSVVLMLGNLTSRNCAIEQDSLLKKLWKI